MDYEQVTVFNRQAINTTKILKAWAGDNYPFHTVEGREHGGIHFMKLAFEAFAAGDEMLGNLHASCAERYFMEAALLRYGSF